MSQPARKKALTAAVVSAAILATLFVPFQKAGGNGYDSVVSQLAFTAAGPAVTAAAAGLTVDAVDLSGNPVQGVWTTIHSSNGTLVGSGYSPLPFAGKADESYKVTVADYDGKIFHHWKDNDSTDRTRTIHFSSASPEENITTITAVYNTGDALRGVTPLNYTGTEEQPDLTVHALTTGNQTLHMYAIIDPQSSNSSGTTYKVYAGNYQDKVFDRWEDGSTDSIRTLTISDDETITAYYRADAAGPAIHMNDTTVSTGQSVRSGRPAHAEYVTPASSLVGKQIDSITMTLKKSGLPTGTAEVGIINENLSMKNVFATLDVSTLSTAYEEFEFASSSPYTIAAGDRIGIKYAEGTSTVNISVMRDTDPADPFDGPNTYHTHYTTSWSNFLSNDLTMTLKLD
ncbi:MAG: hypothetical protein ACREAY_11580 [Nitrososphaera sp.]|uniref:hypothetical protein n=1 Tax=Nitrososphaera sp. TaxID=1971748 RepID=UPI003D6EEF64